MLTTEALVKLVNQILADIERGRITSVTDGFRLEFAPEAADRLREEGYPELADKLLAV